MASTYLAALELPAETAGTGGGGMRLHELFFARTNCPLLQSLESGICLGGCACG